MSKKYTVYILKNPQGKIYIGQTDNLEKRIKRHNIEDGAKFTKANKGEFKIVYFEEYQTRKQAMNREFQIKKWSRAKKEALINNDLNKLKKLSKRKKNIIKKVIFCVFYIT